MKKNVLLIVIFLLSICYIISELYYINDNEAKIGDNTIVYYKNNKLDKIKYVDKINKRYDYKKFNIYNKGNIESGTINIIDNQDLYHMDIYDDEFNKLYINDHIVYKNVDLKILDVNTTSNINENDKIKINKFLNKNNLSLEYYFYEKSVIKLKDSLINIYYIDNFAMSSDSYYRIMFIEKDGEYELIKLNKYTNENIMMAENFKLINLVDIDLDNEYELMLMSSEGENGPTYYKFYKYDEVTNKVKEIK